MVTKVIRAVEFASGKPCPHSGQFLATFDHEAHDGQGYGVFTEDIAKAMKFADVATAFEFYQRIPKCRRRRADGKPNRPLTALTIVIENA